MSLWDSRYNYGIADRIFLFKLLYRKNENFYFFLHNLLLSSIAFCSVGFDVCHKIWYVFITEILIGLFIVEM